MKNHLEASFFNAVIKKKHHNLHLNLDIFINSKNTFSTVVLLIKFKKAQLALYMAIDSTCFV